MTDTTKPSKDSTTNTKAAAIDSFGQGDYHILIDGKICVYDHWAKIPEDYDELIKFLPVVPQPPHTEEQHADIDKIPEIFRRFLMKARWRTNPPLRSSKKGL
jgi:hypothetical protein